MKKAPSAAIAQLDLRETSDGGLALPMPSGTPSLLLVFGDIMVGAVIEARDRDALAPGDMEVPVTLKFWAEEALSLAVPGASFTLHYDRRDVGTGKILQAQEAS